MSMNFLEKLGALFLLPGNYICGALGVEGEDHRLILRAFTNLLFYSVITFVIVLVFFV